MLPSQPVIDIKPRLYIWHKYCGIYVTLTYPYCSIVTLSSISPEFGTDFCKYMYKYDSIALRNSTQPFSENVMHDSSIHLSLVLILLPTRNTYWWWWMGVSNNSYRFWSLLPNKIFTFWQIHCSILHNSAWNMINQYILIIYALFCNGMDSLEYFLIATIT